MDQIRSESASLGRMTKQADPVHFVPSLLPSSRPRCDARHGNLRPPGRTNTQRPIWLVKTVEYFLRVMITLHEVKWGPQKCIVVPLRTRLYHLSVLPKRPEVFRSSSVLHESCNPCTCPCAPHPHGAAQHHPLLSDLYSCRATFSAPTAILGTTAGTRRPARNSRER
ncbi:hypothetical protein PHLGIDRAFT_166382 [Phlebiopsis gigantea 11061_1 CR5-6]|uniref:Uncharacterized protein n=1 Tax=Phlebiopsis gigantea (strain 11061_1 CR5-6) TaxID=745531 RepID=A0A0C3NJL3_PHLG1|nr:hypothetical protein PHLGIDRAFT_166382 [Phlebiopsis gigantea 11061_1 CR5-6]